jgi:hypothetical protein
MFIPQISNGVAFSLFPPFERKRGGMKRRGKEKGEKPKKGKRRLDVPAIVPPSHLAHDRIVGLGPVDRGKAWREVMLGFTIMREDICRQVGGEKDDGDLIIRRRIGDFSTTAQVFETVFRAHNKRTREKSRFALKSMPHTSYLSEDEQDFAIALADQASQQVIKGLTQYFPLIYAHGFCNVVHLARPLLKARETNPVEFALFDRANNWKAVKYLIDTYVFEAYQEAQLKRFRNADPFFVYETLKHEYEPFKIDARFLTGDISVKLSLPVSGAYLAMELAWGSLAAFITSGPEKYRTEEALDDLIGETILAIVHMQFYLGKIVDEETDQYGGIYHGDLDTSNVLVQLSVRDPAKPRTVTPTPLVTGFSRARGLTDANRFKDVETLMNDLLVLKDHLPEYIVSKIHTIKLRAYYAKGMDKAFENDMQNVFQFWKGVEFVRPLEELVREEKEKLEKKWREEEEVSEKKEQESALRILDPEEAEREGFRVFRRKDEGAMEPAEERLAQYLA